MSSEEPPKAFQIFTSVRYDPLLLKCPQNSDLGLNFITPSPFYMLKYHRDRLLEAAQHFEFPAVVKRLEDQEGGEGMHFTLLMSVKDWIAQGKKNQPLKLRVIYHQNASISIEMAPIPAVPLSTLFPPSFSLPPPPPPPHPASKFTPSSKTGGALELGSDDSLPASTSSPVPSTDLAKEPQPPTWILHLDTAPTQTSAFTSLKTTHRPFYDRARSRALPSNSKAPAFEEVMLYNSCNELTEGSLTSLYFYRGGRWVTPPVGVPASSNPSSDKSPGVKRKGAETYADSDADSPSEGVGKGEGDEAADISGHPHHDEGEGRAPFAGRWGHSVRSAKVGSGGQRGTTRRWALGQGMCMEEPVSVDTVKVGEVVWVSNGVRGFGWGKVVE